MFKEAKYENGITPFGVHTDHSFYSQRNFGSLVSKKFWVSITRKCVRLLSNRESEIRSEKREGGNDVIGRKGIKPRRKGKVKTCGTEKGKGVESQVCTGRKKKNLIAIFLAEFFFYKKCLTCNNITTAWHVIMLP